MLYQVIVTIAIFIFMLPIALSFSVGFSKITKVGFGIILFGFVTSFITNRFVMPTYISNLDSSFAKRDVFDHVMFLNDIVGIGLWIMITGLIIVFSGSVVTTWQKRKRIFPFIYQGKSKR